MMRVFIVDDEKPARDRLRVLLSDIVPQCPHDLVGESDNPVAALDGIAATKADLVLLDVQMPGMSGIDFAGRLAQMPHPPAVVFITAHDQYALKAFDLEAADYLLKPVRAERLAAALQRVAKARGQMLAEGGDASPVRRQHFSVIERGRVRLVPVREVIFLKAELKYVTLHTRDRDYLIEEPLVSIEQSWPEVFVRVHRNALVAREAILGVERALAVEQATGADKGGDAWEVVLRGSSERLPISRRQWPVVKALVR